MCVTCRMARVSSCDIQAKLPNLTVQFIPNSE